MKKYLILGFLALSILSVGARAAESNSAEPTKEAREKMAVEHEKVAACLRSDKSVMECHKAMHEAMHSAMHGAMHKDCDCEMGEGKKCPMKGKMKKSAAHHEAHEENTTKE